MVNEPLTTKKDCSFTLSATNLDPMFFFIYFSVINLGLMFSFLCLSVTNFGLVYSTNLGFIIYIYKVHPSQNIKVQVCKLHHQVLC